MLTVISRFVMLRLALWGRLRAHELQKKARPIGRALFTKQVWRQWLACPVVLGCLPALPPGARVSPACELDDCFDVLEAAP